MTDEIEVGGTGKEVGAVLVLADGTVYKGAAIGARGAASGEVVFNTSMTGYQEVFSDPSYCGQIVAMTCPHIGNVGSNPLDDEAARPHLSGLVVMRPSSVPSNWRSEADLDDWMKHHGIVGIHGIDQRALTRKVRTDGSIPGLVVSPSEMADLDQLVEQAGGLPSLAGQDLAGVVTCPEPYSREDRDVQDWVPAPTVDRGKAVVLDFGVKRSILDCLWSVGYRVEVVPASATCADILGHAPVLVVMSNGPGDPEPVSYAVQTARELVGKVPLFGICLGHQILGLALGASTYKLKFGHHGGNHPVKDLKTGRVLVTAQNHGFAVDPESLPKGCSITFKSLNDGTLEGFEAPDRNVRTVQFHPEAGPGPHDARFLFDDI
ncbi:MAG: glutamine-hydrolyzing carbamoyl-phosphate synthase small subunit [Deltaproteobacteria bacterium]|nr:glutamine-hydrolyzing carbamoyl-phosphate synthase small subunit [Deltaproteobacteria bacterium]